MPLVLNGTTGVQDNSGAFVAGTAVASTSGTSIDFTSIPSWVKRITVMFQGVSTNGSTDLLIQLGDSGGIENTGYAGTATRSADASNARIALSAGVNINSGGGAAAASNNGQCVFSLINSATNLWAFAGLNSNTNINQATTFAGTKSLSGVLDRVRVTATNGTDTFDAGSINILYE
jgi:hypothetical protein